MKKRTLNFYITNDGRWVEVWKGVRPPNSYRCSDGATVYFGNKRDCTRVTALTISDVTPESVPPIGECRRLVMEDKT